MVAAGYNSYEFDFLSVSNRDIKGFFSLLKAYPRILINTIKLNVFLDVMISNFDKNIGFGAVNNMESLEKYLEVLEEFEENIKQIKSSDDYNKWYMKPINYVLNKVYDNVIFLEGLITGKQSELIFNNSSAK